MTIKIVPDSAKGVEIIVEPPKSKQAYPKRHWCFTLNNYIKEDIVNICTISAKNNIKYIFQEETGKEGTKHLQGYICFAKKNRPMAIFNIKAHWGGTRNVKASIRYCCKEESRTGEIYTNFHVPIKTLESGKFYDWQKKVVEICKSEPNDRTVNWFWSKKGCKGKTAIAKWICYNMNAILVGGANNNMKFAIAKMCEKSLAPTIVIIDLPRSSTYVSYVRIEEIKNGIFFSSKFESGMCIFNSPHVFVFANRKPDKDQLSKDRWNIVKV